MNSLRRTIIKSLVTFFAGVCTGFFSWRWFKKAEDPKPSQGPDLTLEKHSGMQEWERASRTWPLNNMAIDYLIAPCDSSTVCISVVWWWEDAAGLERIAQDWPFLLTNCPPHDSDEFDILLFCFADNVVRLTDKYAAAGHRRWKVRMT